MEPFTPYTQRSSRPPAAAAIDKSTSMDASSSYEISGERRFIAGQIDDHDTLDTTHYQNPHHQADMNRRPQVPQSGTDLYTYNSLNSFSFGSVQIRTGSLVSQSVHPLLNSHSDDSGDDTCFVCPSDATPRPSVVIGYDVHQSMIRSHPAQPSGKCGPLPPDTAFSGAHPGLENRQPSAISDSRRTSENKLPGASSISPGSVKSSRADHRTRHSASSRSQTAIHDPTDDDDDPAYFRNDTHSTDIGSSGTGTGNSTAVEFSSGEDYGDSDSGSDYDSYDEEGVNIEIGSAQFEGSTATHDWNHDSYSFDGAGRETTGTRPSADNSERRGSLPMAIPGAPVVPGRGDISFFHPVRNREDSVATLRRPSRSLDDEFQNLRLRSTADGTSKDSSGPEKITAPAPTSVPESDSDWKYLEERSKNKGNSKGHTSSSSAGIQEDFDLQDWNQNLGGIRGITALDPDDLVDIIGPSSQSLDGRRPSTRSSRWLSLLGNGSARRPSTATVPSLDDDPFGKAINSWGGDGYQAQRRDWSFRREKADRSDDIFSGIGDSDIGRNSITDVSTPSASMMTEGTGVAFSVGDKDKEGGSIRSDRAMKSGPGWKGMQLEDQELWTNDLVGRFRVTRRAIKSTDPSKGPQQRLVVQHFRDGYTSPHVKHNGPPVTIHKHSKAIAFSISRHYGTSAMSYPSRDGSFSGGPHRSSGRGHYPVTSRTEAGPDAVSAAKRSSSMILLAPRRVQEAFTNTNSTRRLKSHGLLEDKTAHDAKGKRRHKRHQEKGKGREKHAGSEQTKVNEDAKGKGKGKNQARQNVPMTGRSPSPTSQGMPPPPAPGPSSHVHFPGIGNEINSSDHSIARSSSHNDHRRHHMHDPPHEDDYDDEEKDFPPTRTPHNETYGTMDTSVIERLRPRQDQQTADHDSNKGFLKRFIWGRGAQPVSIPLPSQNEAPYVPPWLTLASRNEQEHQQRVVDNLNTSFKDVGLVPSQHKDRPNQKPTKIASGSSNNLDIFQRIPSDSLYMLLPLWPGETGPTSECKMEMFEKPHIPSEERQYLLVFYKPLEEGTCEEQSRSRGEGEGRTRSRNSPTSSYETRTRKDKTASILLSSFHISARPILYTALQGSGVRVPDEGLTVTGPLDVAFRTMPPLGERGLYEWVLGVCQSREAGIEFYPDGMVKLGLCISEPSADRVLSEEDEPPEPNIELTPIGRAVMEMAWLGALALTSFGPEL